MFLETMDGVSCLLAALSPERMHGQAPRVSRRLPRGRAGETGEMVLLFCNLASVMQRLFLSRQPWEGLLSSPFYKDEQT